jgi:hypothetical protein
MKLTADVIEAAERAGFDLSLLESNLNLSHEERLLRHDGALELVQEMRAAGRVLYAQAPLDSPAPR